MCRTLVDVSIGSGLHNPAFLFVSVAVSVYYKEEVCFYNEEWGIHLSMSIKTDIMIVASHCAGLVY